MKKIGLVGIYFPGAYDALHEHVPEGFELVDNPINMVNDVYSNIVKFDQGLPLNSDKDIVNAQYLKAE